MKPYAEFREAVRKRESSNRYDCVNALGYVGAYQFGLARLCDLGLTRRKNPAGKSFANKEFTFTSISQEEFLNSPALQDSCFDQHVHRLRFLCLKKYPELKSGVMKHGLDLDLSGAIMVCHLLGPGGLADLMTGHVTRDALGTSATDYAVLFHGYEIPV